MEWTGFGVLLDHIRELIVEWESLPAPLQWTGFAFIILFIEFNFPRLLIIWFALAAFAAAVIAGLFPDAIVIQVSVFLAVAFACLYYRADLVRLITPVDRLGSFVDAVIGRETECVQEIKGMRSGGLIALSGAKWSALCVTNQNIRAGARVRVIGRRNHELFVEPFNSRIKSNSRLIRKLVGKQFTGNLDEKNKITVSVGKSEVEAEIFPVGNSLPPSGRVEVLAVCGTRLLVEPVASPFVVPGDLVGKTGYCVNQIGGKKRTGALKIDGVTWQARPAHQEFIKKGQLAQIVDFDGIVPIVKLIDRIDSPSVTTYDLGN